MAQVVQSTSPGYPATAEMLFAAWNRIDGIVEGRNLTLAKLPHPEVAAAFLRMVDALRPQAGR